MLPCIVSSTIVLLIHKKIIPIETITITFETNLKNMKKLLKYLLIAGAVFYINGCSSPGGDPKATLSAFFDAMSKKDFEAARKLATADSKNMFDLMETGLSRMKDKEGAENMINLQWK